MNKLDAALSMIKLELEQANAKFRPIHSPHEGLAIIREEYLELEQGIFHANVHEWHIEAYQLAAMCVRLSLDVAMPMIDAISDDMGWPTDE